MHRRLERGEPDRLKIPSWPTSSAVTRHQSHPADGSDGPPEIAIQVQYGDTTAEIGDTLVKAGVIADARAFVFEAIERGATSNFIAGRHVVTGP